jgi:hypothetical protein
MIDLSIVWGTLEALWRRLERHESGRPWSLVLSRQAVTQSLDHSVTPSGSQLLSKQICGKCDGTSAWYLQQLHRAALKS